MLRIIRNLVRRLSSAGQSACFTRRRSAVRARQSPPVEGLDTQFVLKSCANLKLAARPKGSDLRDDAPPVEGLDTQSVLKSCANLKLAARPKGPDLSDDAPPKH